MVARHFNVEITRGTHWQVSDSRGAGCQLFLWEFLVVFVVGACVPLLILAAMFFWFCLPSTAEEAVHDIISAFCYSFLKGFSL